LLTVQFLFSSTHKILSQHWTSLEFTFRATFLVLPKWAHARKNWIYKIPQEPTFPNSLVLISQNKAQLGLNWFRSKLIVSVQYADIESNKLQLNSIHKKTVFLPSDSQALQENTRNTDTWAECIYWRSENWKILLLPVALVLGLPKCGFLLAKTL
jgi:hypothetical protein